MSSFFDTLLEKITTHPTYGPAMKQASGGGKSLVLNWHNHGDPGMWCVSICAKVADPNKILQIGIPDLEELVHVKGIGQTAEEGAQFCEIFGAVLKQHYALDHTPEPFLNGTPMAIEG